ncbi:MAG: DUF1588 domain-containing protein [Polyangiaceae bacterium]|nr:DUF1588 domain-containing protein [Polyangiaceae bacterium]
MTERTVRTSPLTSTLGRMLVALAASLLLGAGCSGEEAGPGDGPGTTNQCLSERDYFAKNVWAPVLAKTCTKCHAPGGQADEEGAKFTLLPSAYPGFVDANLAAAKLFAKTEYDGKSVLLRKPLGELEHGGEKQLEADSAEYRALEAFIQKVKNNDFCQGGSSVKGFDDVVLHDTLTTYRMATLNLAARLPNAGEIQRILDDGEQALEPLLDELMKEDAFFTRLKEMYNDMLLGDRYLGYSSYALNLLNKSHFPQAGDAWFETLPDAEKPKVNTAIAREPLELIAYIVRNERPFTEVLTADYTLMNPMSARVYNASLQFSNPNDENEWKAGQIVAKGNPANNEPADMVLPHAGVLSSPIFLNRFPTTPTNLNRHRARMVLKFFLATDILRIAERPIDPTQATSYNNPTREDPSCNVCHRMLDPIAGAFMKFNDNDQEKFEPNKNWHAAMFPPGFGKEVMETSQYGQALSWLAERVVKDPRFSLSVVYTAFHALTGEEPLAYPDVDDEGFEQKLASWESQDALFRSIGDVFVASNYNLKAAFKGVILSPYFRAKNTLGTPTPARQIELGAVGTGKLSTPEVLARKIQAVTGLPWARTSGGYKVHLLTTDYRILYGGIDSDDVTMRLTVPNGVMANVGWRMANEVACQTTAWDLSLSKHSDRFLFPYVTVDDTPESNAASIRKNIQYLHAHILGEALPAGDPELERTYELFVATLAEGQAKLASQELGASLSTACRARRNPYTEQDLPTDQRLEQDPDYTVRAWTAVISYLLADFGFLYE